MPTGDLYYTSCKICGQTMPVSYYRGSDGYDACLNCAVKMDTIYQTKQKADKIQSLAKEIDGYFKDKESSIALYPKNEYNPMFKTKENPSISLMTDLDMERLGIKSKKETLVVNLFGGPGTGKSTIAAGIFHDLKWLRVECELAAEYCKDLCWEKREKTFEDQIYIFGKQYHRIHRLLGQVDVIITDSPILLSPIYDKEKRPTFEQLVVEEHRKMWTYNVFLKRVKTYNPNGRLHNEDEARGLDRAIADLLLKHGEAYEVFHGSPDGKDAIVRKILRLLDWNNENEK